MPPEKTDFDILRDIHRRFRANPEIDPEALDVDVREGVVTLNGTLQSDDSHQAVLKEAADAAGVKKVIDNLNVAD